MDVARQPMLTPRGRWRTPLFGAAARALWRADAQRKADWIAPFIARGASLLEVGAGPGFVVERLRACGYAVTAVDVADAAYTESVRPVIYDGNALPFADASFDAALVLTVLHHCRAPLRVLAEAARVGRRVIVVEDIYDGPMQRRVTKIVDSLVNLEFRGHPHSNQDDAGWRASFEAMGLRLRHADRKPYFGAFVQALYVVER